MRNGRPVVGQGIIAGLSARRETRGRPPPPVCQRKSPWYRSVLPGVSCRSDLVEGSISAADTTTRYPPRAKRLRPKSATTEVTEGETRSFGEHRITKRHRAARSFPVSSVVEPLRVRPSLAAG